MVAVLLPDLGLPIGLAKQPMKEVVGDAGETSAPSRSASGLISVHCALYSVQCKRTVYSVQCTVYSVQCTVYSVQGCHYLFIPVDAWLQIF